MCRRKGRKGENNCDTLDNPCFLKWCKVIKKEGKKTDLDFKSEHVNQLNIYIKVDIILINDIQYLN